MNSTWTNGTCVANITDSNSTDTNSTDSNSTDSNSTESNSTQSVSLLSFFYLLATGEPVNITTANDCIYYEQWPAVSIEDEITYAPIYDPLYY
jgi:hypothetical protein